MLTYCKHCANSVKECLSKIDKVQAVTVDLGQGKAFIKANATLDVALIKDAITSSGFTFIGMTKIDWFRQLWLPTIAKFKRG